MRYIGCRVEDYCDSGSTNDNQALYHTDHRHYLPFLGIFLQREPLMVWPTENSLGLSTDPTNLNPYRYAENSPVDNSDPTGLVPPGQSDPPVIDPLVNSTGATPAPLVESGEKDNTGGGIGGWVGRQWRKVTKTGKRAWDAITRWLWAMYQIIVEFWEGIVLPFVEKVKNTLNEWADKARRFLNHWLERGLGFIEHWTNKIRDWWNNIDWTAIKYKLEHYLWKIAEWFWGLVIVVGVAVLAVFFMKLAILIAFFFYDVVLPIIAILGEWLLWIFSGSILLRILYGIFRFYNEYDTVIEEALDSFRNWWERWWSRPTYPGHNWNLPAPQPYRPPWPRPGPRPED